MTLPLRIRAEASAELNAAWNWYENQREGLGDDLLGCVDAAGEKFGHLRDDEGISFAKRRERAGLRRNEADLDGLLLGEYE